MAKAENTGAGMKIDHRKRIDDLKAKCQVVAQSKHDQLKATGSGKWEVLKAGVPPSGRHSHCILGGS